MTEQEKLTKAVTPAVLEEFYNDKIAPYLNGMGNNYSLNEQVVGTWIDGKPIYQKTIVDTLPTVTTDYVNTSKTISLSGLNIDEVVNFDSCFKSPTSTYIKLNDVWNGNTESNMWICRNFVDANKITININRKDISGSKYIITLKYTKITD